MIEPEILNNPYYGEVALLGSILQDGDVALDLAGDVNPEDFAVDSHQRIFRVMREMSRQGEGIDLMTVWHRLQVRGEGDAVGGPAYLAQLMNGVPRNSDVTRYAALTKEEATGRRAARVLQGALERLMARAANVNEILDEVSRQLTIERPDDTKTAAEVVGPALLKLEKSDHLIIPSGIADLDSMLHRGFRTKELVVIGAQPSAGKSALCRQIERAAMLAFLDAAERKECEPFGMHSFTMEVSDEQWVLKHTANLARIPSWKLREPKWMSPVDKDQVLGAGMQIEHWPYRIDDAAGLTIDSLLAKARISAMRHNTKLFTIDYLQLLLRDIRNARLEMSMIVRRLKQFAKEFDCCVIALSQLARQDDINKKPTVKDLKESGDIEAAADVIVLNYRPKDLDQGNYTGEDELIIGKQRDGGVGALKQFFNSETLCFEPRRA